MCLEEKFMNRLEGKEETEKVSGLSRSVAWTNLILTLVLLVLFIIFLTKPLFYFTQTYCGGFFTEEEVMEICIENSRDLQEFKEANFGAQIIVGGACVFLFIASLNAISCALRLHNNCRKSPVNKAVGSFCFILPVTVLYGALKLVMDSAFKVAVEHEGDFKIKELDMFNVCDAAFILGIVLVFVGVTNIITSVKAKKEAKNFS